MGTTFVITLKTALRDKSVLIWAIIFPLLLTVLFYMAFSGLDNLNKFDPVGVVVVNDSNYKNSSFKDVVETLSEEGDDQILDLTLVPDVDTAKRTLASGAGYGYYTVDEDGDPSLYLNETDAVSSMTTTQVDCMICKNIADTYIRYKDTFEKIIEENPEILRDTNVLENLLGSSDEQFTQSVTVTPNEASETVRYYYALLGFAAIMTCNVALATIPKCLSGTSIVGSRRNMSPEPKSRMILSTFLASWVLSFIFLLIVFMFLIFVIGVNFSGREGYCLIGLLLASLVANAMGTAIGVIPKISEGSKGGISAGIVCLLSMFAGLYGNWCMALADTIDSAAPILGYFNPVKQAADMFYDLYYYTSLQPFFTSSFVIVLLSIALIAISLILIRRQRYASL